MILPPLSPEGFPLLSSDMPSLQDERRRVPTPVQAGRVRQLWAR